MEGFGATSQLSGFLRFQPKRRDDLLSHLSTFPSYHFQIFHHTIFTYLDGIIFEITIFHNPHSHNPLAAHIGEFQLIPKSSSPIDSIKNPTLLNSIIITIISDRFHRNHKIFQFPPAQLSLPPLIDSIAIKLSCTLHHHCQYSIINANIPSLLSIFS